MYISCSIGQGDRIKEMTVSADKGETLAPLEAFFNGHKWIRMNEEGRLRQAPVYKKTPKPTFDQDTGPIWTKGPVKLRRRSEKGASIGGRSFFVQHIGGYSGNRKKKAQRMVLAGFSVLRSHRGTDGKCWEIWYLPGDWAAEGEIRNKSERQILNWLRNEIAPGQIELSGGTWGLRHPEE